MQRNKPLTIIKEKPHSSSIEIPSSLPAPPVALRIDERSSSIEKNQDSKRLTSPNNSIDYDGISTASSLGFKRRGSYLYRSDSESEPSGPPRASRHSSLSSEAIHAEELVTPFAQILSTLKNARANFFMLTNIRDKQFRRGSEGFHLNSRLCQLYEISDGSMIRDDMFKKLTMETIKEFDWCLDQLDTLKASMSISEMASNKFKRILDKELKERGAGGEDISAWVLNTYVDKKMDTIDTAETEPVRVRSRSLVKSHKKISSTVSSPVAVPRFGVGCANESALEKIMEQVDSWKFNVFELESQTNNRPLAAITYTILRTRNLLKTFKIKPYIFMNYINLVEAHYVRDVPFHNSTHAADVVHATHILLDAPTFEGLFSDLEIFAALIAASIHDADHPGVNNQFLVNSSSEMALMYNDESVLENHHLAVGFQLLQTESCDILENFSKEERQKFRKIVIDMVLATDSAKHMGILGSLKTMVETKKISHGTLNPIKIEPLSEKMHVLKCLIHCADLSNPTRPTQLYEKWVGRLMGEFFRQGDIEREKGMDISPMMDRHNSNIEKSQVVFIDYVVHPLWETWNDLVHPDTQHIMDQLADNREYYFSQSSKGAPSTPTGTPKSSSLPSRNSMPAAIDITKSKPKSDVLSKSVEDSTDGCNLINIHRKRISSEASFLVKNDIKLFQNRSRNSIDIVDNMDYRRKSDSALLRNDAADSQLVQQEILKYSETVDKLTTEGASTEKSNEPVE